MIRIKKQTTFLHQTGTFIKNPSEKFTYFVIEKYDRFKYLIFGGWRKIYIAETHEMLFNKLKEIMK